MDYKAFHDEQHVHNYKANKNTTDIQNMKNDVPRMGCFTSQDLEGDG